MNLALVWINNRPGLIEVEGLKPIVKVPMGLVDVNVNTMSPGLLLVVISRLLEKCNVLASIEWLANNVNSGVAPGLTTSGPIIVIVPELPVVNPTLEGDGEVGENPVKVYVNL